MDIMRMTKLKEDLMEQVECYLEGGWECVDTKELGEVVDMVKDLSEALYYCEITKAMQTDGDGKWCKDDHKHTWSTDHSNEPHDTHKHESWDAKAEHEEAEMRHPYEGKSGLRRKMYMDGKMHGKDKARQMQELESYMQELTGDLMEMIADASPEERALLQQKVSILASKIK